MHLLSITYCGTLWILQFTSTYMNTCQLCKRLRSKNNPRYCSAHSKHLKQFQGRDRNREIVRILFKHTCQNQDCGKKWNGTDRRFHVHHLNGLCGKKSREYDGIEHIEKLTLLCPRCHSHEHGKTGSMKIAHAKRRLLTPRKLTERNKTIYRLYTDPAMELTQDRIAKMFDISQCAVNKIIAQQRSLRTG